MRQARDPRSVATLDRCARERMRTLAEGLYPRISAAFAAGDRAKAAVLLTIASEAFASNVLGARFEEETQD